MKHYNIKITGSVQGIFFRQSAKEKAEALGLRGFARNESDGSVYIEVEGNEPALKEFTTWCRQGPNSAHIEKVETTEANPKNFSGFEIL